jgi:arylsulfatase A-like enzyme
MPTLTNPNHASILTGVYAQAHGIIANRWWDGRTGAALDQSALIETRTIFTVAAASPERPRTAGIFGKAKLARLFASAATQRSPDRLWGDSDEASGAESDRRTMDEVLRTIAAEDPAFVFVNLGDVDRRSHSFGPRSPEANEALAGADRQIERLVAFLEERQLWSESVVMITGDHGLSPIERSVQNQHPAVSFGRVLARAGIEDVAAVSNGTIEFLYLRGPQASSVPLRRERLERVRALALQQPEIAEALDCAPESAAPARATQVDVAHPEWRLSHARAGDMLLVARPGHVFADPSDPAADEIRGSHGGPANLEVPIIMTGGYPHLRSQVIMEGRQAENPDLGMTALHLLGLPEPRFTSGQPVPVQLRGRVLDEAFTP